MNVGGESPGAVRASSGGGIGSVTAPHVHGADARSRSLEREIAGPSRGAGDVCVVAKGSPGDSRHVLFTIPTALVGGPLRIPFDPSLGPADTIPWDIAIVRPPGVHGTAGGGSLQVDPLGSVRFVNGDSVAGSRESNAASRVADREPTRGGGGDWTKCSSGMAPNPGDESHSVAAREDQITCAR